MGRTGGNLRGHGGSRERRSPLPYTAWAISWTPPGDPQVHFCYTFHHGLFVCQALSSSSCMSPPMSIHTHKGTHTRTLAH